MQSNFILYKDEKVFYNTIGKGFAVVLLHGFAEDGDVWKYQTEFLKEQYQLIIPDLPGSGLSPFNKQLKTMEDYADAIKAILDNEKIETCIIIGHSMGGYITLAIAEKYPELLKAFGLFHSTAFADTEEKKQVRLKAIDFINTNGAATFIKTTTYNLFAQAYKTNHAQQIEALIERGKIFSADAFVQYYNAMIARPDRTAILKNSTVPILFIIGKEDVAVPFQSSLQQCYLPSLAYINILSNSGHMGLWEEAVTANKNIFKFLQEVA